MPELLRGYSSEQGLHRLLELRGQACTRQELREQAGGVFDQETLLRLLQQHGIEARPVRTQTADLAHLDLPTLLRQGEDAWLILRDESPGGFLVESADGSRDLSLEELGAELDGWALELRQALPRTKSLWRAALVLVGRHQRTILQVAGASLGLQLLALVSPQFTRFAMDRALPEGGGSLLGLVAIGMVLVALFQAWVGWLRQRTLLFLETRLEVGLAQDFLSHVLSLPFPFLHKRSLGDMLQAHVGLEAAQNLLTERMLGSVLDGLLAFLYLGVMAASMPGPTVAVVLVTVVMLVLVLVVGRLQENFQRREVEAQIRERGFLAELLKGVATLKAAGAEGPTLRRWLGMLGEELTLSLGRQRVGIWSEVGLDGLRQALTVVILIWGGSLVLDGTARIGSLMAFAQMSSAFLGAVLGLAQAYLSLRVLKPQLAKVTEYLEVDPEPPAAQGSSATLTGPVHLEDVWFRYGPENPWVLKGYNLHVEPGEKRWIHAPSGFGKSTLLRVIAGLCPAERGHLHIGGLEPADAKHQMIYLPQFVQLYGGSILENLRLLSGGAAHDRLMAVAETTGLDRLVETLPMRYNTVLPQGGGSLSGGQRQLVALTAVMASDRSLMLLDEAMANLDWISRSWLHQSEWFKDKTVIYASHEAGLG
jgi:ABC-type bacteriocin/lantibiotic exporter with double-glycine peptidase domain